MDIRDFISRARKAQQEHEQKHDVQLEVPGWDEEPVRISDEFVLRRQAQIEDETGRDPRD